ncbi:MAG: hypothetical protein EZS28_051376, partial [Streblomastix strix]
MLQPSLNQLPYIGIDLEGNSELGKDKRQQTQLAGVGGGTIWLSGINLMIGSYGKELLRRNPGIFEIKYKDLASTGQDSEQSSGNQQSGNNQSGDRNNAGSSLGTSGLERQMNENENIGSDKQKQSSGSDQSKKGNDANIDLPPMQNFINRVITTRFSSKKTQITDKIGQSPDQRSQNGQRPQSEGRSQSEGRIQLIRLNPTPSQNQLVAAVMHKILIYNQQQPLLQQQIYTGTEGDQLIEPLTISNDISDLMNTQRLMI